MKISGYVCVRNQFGLDYCGELAVRSLLPVCDEVLVSVGIAPLQNGDPDDDGTYEFYQNWAGREPKLCVMPYQWTNPHRDIKWWVSWLNTAREQLRYPMQLTLDADEILCDKSYPAILESAKRGEARWFSRLTFWRDAQHLVPKGQVVGDQVVRLGPSNLWMPSDEGHPEGEPEIRVRAGWPPNGDRSLRVFHYGMLRKEKAMIEKVRVVNGAFFGTMDERLEKAEAAGTPWIDSIEMAAPLQNFNEPHPEIAHAWLRERGYEPTR